MSRVLYCSEAYGPHDHRFLSTIKSFGHSPFHVHLGKEFEARVNPADEVLILSGAEFGARQEKLREFVEAHAIDLVHAGPIQTIGFLAASSELARPLVVMSWGSDLLRKEQYGALSDDVASFVLDKADAFIADCKSVFDCAKLLGWSGLTAIFPWGIDLQKFQPDGEVVTFDSSADITILSNRNWEPIYNVASVTEAFARIAKTNSNVHLIIVGSGSQEKAVLDPLSRLPESRFTVLGSVAHDALPEIYRGVDLYVSASLSDGSSISLLEAMGCARPVCVSKIPGNLEWVESGSNGFVFDPDSIDSIETELLRALESTTLVEMGLSNRKIVEERADWNRNSRRLMALYDDVLEGRDGD